MNSHNYSKMGDITQKWVNLLNPFSSNYSTHLSATEISKKTGIPQQTASRGLNELSEKNLIAYTIEGKNKMFYLDLKKTSSKKLLNIIENQKALNFILENKDAYIAVDEILAKCKSIILFGSYAKGTQSKKSDLDIAILGSKKSIEDIKLRNTIQINEHYTSYREFGKHLKNKNPLALEMIDNHIFFGNTSELVDVLLEWNNESRKR